MTGIPDEIRFAITLLLSAFVFASSYRFARRATGHDWIACSFDAFLLTYLVQYLAVTAPGLMGILSPWTMCGCALVLSALPLLFTRVAVRPDPAAQRTAWAERIAPLICLLFVLGYLAGIVQVSMYSPPLVDDALTYHLPAAVQWLRTGHIGLYTTWFFNPANTYSPLASSTFLAWLIGPIGNDVLANWVQMPALIMIYFGIVELCRALGARSSIAAIIALGAVLSRPLVSQSFEAKDDLFAAAFFLAAVVGCAQAKLSDRLGPWRIGIAIGLFASIKYTALLSAPILLLLIDAPVRARWSWRRWLIMLGSAILLTAPWYARNWIVAGNPLYPIPVSIGSRDILKGMFVTAHSTEMSAWTGVWDCLTDRKRKFHSPSPELLIALLAGCFIATVLAIRRLQILRNPLIRVCTLGPLLGLLIFIFASHAGEVRYIYPSIILLYAAFAFVAEFVASGNRLLGLALAIALALLSIWGSFASKDFVFQYSLYGSIAAIIGVVLTPLPWSNPRLRWGAIGAAACAIAACVYIYLPGYLSASMLNFHRAWNETKGEPARLWQWVDQNVEPGARIAYTNAYMLHAMLGFGHGRTLAYAPTRPGVHFYHDLPPSRTPVTDQQIRGFVAGLLTSNADKETWLSNLRAIGPQYLLIGKQDVLQSPPERKFSDEDPRHFQRVFENNSGAVYRVYLSN